MKASDHRIAELLGGDARLAAEDDDSVMRNCFADPFFVVEFGGPGEHEQWKELATAWYHGWDDMTDTLVLKVLG